MRAFAADGSIKGSFAPMVFSVVPVPMLCWATLFAEALLAFGLWIPKLKKPTIATGVGLHLAIGPSAALPNCSMWVI